MNCRSREACPREGGERESRKGKSGPSGNDLMLVNEIFHSIQGESTRAGLPCVFVRLTGCNLRCGYCDTTYAYDEGKEMSIARIAEAVSAHHCHLVEITGGEPLAQADTAELAEKLISLGHTVMVETNGTFDISVLPEEAIKIVDIKTPESGEAEKFLYENLKCLTKNDELKFVICSKCDFDWALHEIERNNLTGICPVNISPAAGKVSFQAAADWILKSGKNLRLNPQLHRIIWGDKRGV